jgi:type III pantothenate kinase
MNLIIDVGNSNVKIALFQDNRLAESYTLNDLGLDFLSGIQNNNPDIKSVILCDVRNNAEEAAAWLKNHFPFFLRLTHETPVPVTNKYLTPQTLGYDRLAGVTGCSFLYPGKNILLIDAGTTITYDFINSDKEYLGGNISPGLQMRFKALNSYTGKLPLMEKKEFFSLLANNTGDAIVSGVQNRIMFEIDQYISRMKEDYPELVVILTGGDAFFFENKLKNAIFAIPDIVITGLHCILKHNFHEN